MTLRILRSGATGAACYGGHPDEVRAAEEADRQAAHAAHVERLRADPHYAFDIREAWLEIQRQHAPRRGGE